MAWTSPLTAVANAVLTAAQWNASVRDNLNETAPAKATTAGRLFVSTGVNAIAERAMNNAFIATSQSTASTSYTNLATSGPAVTLTTGTNALTMIGSLATNSAGGSSSWMSIEVSGASASAASDTRAWMHTPPGAADLEMASFVFLFDTLTPGSNVFTSKYRVSAGTGTWSQRSICVMGL
jgi:hypothetical protein